MRSQMLSHMVRGTAQSSHTGCMAQYQWEGLQGEAAKPLSPGTDAIIDV